MLEQLAAIGRQWNRTFSKQVHLYSPIFALFQSSKKLFYWNSTLSCQIKCHFWVWSKKRDRKRNTLMVLGMIKSEHSFKPFFPLASAYLYKQIKVKGIISTRITCSTMNCLDDKSLKLTLAQPMRPQSFMKVVLLQGEIMGCSDKPRRNIL